MLSRYTVAIFAPVPAIVVIFTSEEYDFVFFTFPPTLCGSKNLDIIYYSIILFMNVIFVIGVPMLFYLLWTLHKVGELKS